MSTSGVTAWSLTARQIVAQAMVELGLLSSGAEPEAAEMDDCLVRLNGMLKSWQGEANLFRETEATVSVTGGSGVVTLPASVRDVASVRHVISGTNHRLLAPWNRSQYLSLPNKASAGSPTIYYLSRQRDAAELHIWPVPSTNVTLKIDYSRVADTVTDGAQTLDIPQEWHEAVILGLAARIAGMFGASRADPATVADVKQRAEMLYQQMLDRDRPDAYVFEPSSYCAYG
jgi:hypothetical protein